MKTATQTILDSERSSSEQRVTQATADAASGSTTTDNSGTIVVKTTREELRALAFEIYNLNEIPVSLGYLSAAAFFMQFLQAFLLILLALMSKSKWYWFVSYPDPDDGVPGFQPSVKQVSDFPLPWLTFLVPLLSGLEHLSCIVFRQRYEYYVARNQNPFRWTEYSFSASLMKVIIAQECGITDIHLLFCIFVLMAVSVQAAATHEAVNAKARSEDRPQNWRPFFIGWVGHLAAWLVMFNYFSVYRNRSDSEGVALITVLVVSMFLLDTSFAVTFTLQWAKVGPFKDYVVGEKVFILLSFTSKTILVWISAVYALETNE